MHAYEICMVSYARKLISEHGVSEFGHMACPNSDFFFSFFFFLFFSFFSSFFLRVSQMSFLKLRVTRATRAFYTGEKSGRSQDLILGGAVKITCEGAKRPSPSERGGGGGGGGGCPPPTVRAFCILMLLMVQFGAYARYFPRIARINFLYLILLWKWLKGGSFTCIHATLFSFLVSLSPSHFFGGIWGGGESWVLILNSVHTHTQLNSKLMW